MAISTSRPSDWDPYHYRLSELGEAVWYLKLAAINNGVPEGFVFWVFPWKPPFSGNFYDGQEFCAICNQPLDTHP